jgi:phosphonopyruvate decarboxylase
MISSKAFYNFLIKNGVDFFCGVPDSLLKDFCAYISDTAKPQKHVVAANEGNAIALSAGYHLATRKFGLVYMQNSGLGNSINPLISLADPAVYGIPMLLLVGWRGEPGTKDEPQHITQGKITLPLLKTMGIAYKVLPQSEAGAKKAVLKAAEYMQKFNAPYALIVKKGTFFPYTKKKASKKFIPSPILREKAIESITNEINGGEIIISTTGKTSRELFEIRERNASGHEKDFLKVGSMGHSSQIALGIALAQPKREVYCIDGDGALLMHMGSLGTVGNTMPKNFKHIVLNNFVHESVGGQPTAAPNMDIGSVARGCGYANIYQARDLKGLQRALPRFKRSKGPALLEIIIHLGSRDDLGRPTLSLVENKEQFMDFVGKGLRAFTAPEKLKKFLEKNKAQRIFLVTGKKSYSTSGAQQMFSSVLRNYKVTQFNDFTPNPTVEDLEKGIKIFRKNNYDAVIAIGGGSVIDIAKLINIFSAERGRAISYIKGKKVLKSVGKPLVAIPTTSGAGSEATCFAVVTINKVKHSVIHESILPTVSIVEPALTMSMPPSVAAATGMDALAQAIESYWSVNSTSVSKRFSTNAINIILNNIVPSVTKPTKASRAALARAAYLAGKAINITQTTAPHALSYFLTSNFNIPHGHAVALTLGAVFVQNSNVSSKDVIDKRGKKYVKKIMNELEHLLGVKSAGAASKKIENIMKKIGLETKLSKLGVEQSDVRKIVSAVNTERLKNNPRRYSKQELRLMLEEIL